MSAETLADHITEVMREDPRKVLDAAYSACMATGNYSLALLMNAARAMHTDARLGAVARANFSAPDAHFPLRDGCQAGTVSTWKRRARDAKEP